MTNQSHELIECLFRKLKSSSSIRIYASLSLLFFRFCCCCNQPQFHHYWCCCCRSIHYCCCCYRFGIRNMKIMTNRSINPLFRCWFLVSLPLLSFRSNQSLLVVIVVAIVVVSLLLLLLPLFRYYPFAVVVAIDPEQSVTAFGIRNTKIMTNRSIDHSTAAVSKAKRIGVPPLLRTESATLCLWDCP